METLTILNPNESRIFKSPLSPNLVRTGVIGDGSCFYHAILYAISYDYIKSSETDKCFQIQNIRKKTAENLTFEKFQQLGQGEIYRFLTENRPDTRMVYEEFKKYVLNEYVDQFSIEHISNYFCINIYIIEASTRYPYYIKPTTSFPLSIAILSIDNHYEILGRLVEKTNNRIQRVFRPTDEFILNIKHFLDRQMNLF